MDTVENELGKSVVQYFTILVLIYTLIVSVYLVLTFLIGKSLFTTIASVLLVIIGLILFISAMYRLLTKKTLIKKYSIKYYSKAHEDHAKRVAIDEKRKAAIKNSSLVNNLQSNSVVHNVARTSDNNSLSANSLIQNDSSAELAAGAIPEADESSSLASNSLIMNENTGIPSSSNTGTVVRNVNNILSQPTASSNDIENIIDGHAAFLSY